MLLLPWFAAVRWNTMDETVIAEEEGMDIDGEEEEWVA
jgi:hypothetical protein